MAVWGPDCTLAAPTLYVVRQHRPVSAALTSSVVHVTCVLCTYLCVNVESTQSSPSVRSLRIYVPRVKIIIMILLLWTPAQRKRASMLYFANVFFNLFFFMAALFSGPGERRFAKVLHVVDLECHWRNYWIFFWSSLNYRVGQKVTKFRIFSDPARKLSALTPERGRIL